MAFGFLGTLHRRKAGAPLRPPPRSLPQETEEPGGFGGVGGAKELDLIGKRDGLDWQPRSGQLGRPQQHGGNTGRTVRLQFESACAPRQFQLWCGHRVGWPISARVGCHPVATAITLFKRLGTSVAGSPKPHVTSRPSAVSARLCPNSWPPAANPTTLLNPLGNVVWPQVLSPQATELDDVEERLLFPRVGDGRAVVETVHNNGPGAEMRAAGDEGEEEQEESGRWRGASGQCSAISES